MLQPFNRAVMTNAGANLLTRAQAGETAIQFTRVATGDGVYDPEEKDISVLQKMTELRSQKNSYPISVVEIYSEYSVKITALITNQNPATGEILVREGYYINEIGLYAKEKDGDDGTEVLYSITTIAGNVGDFMPPYNGHNPAQIIQDYIVTVNNAAEVTIQTGAGAVALAEDIEKLKEELKNVSVNVMEGATSENDGKAGLVPVPTVNDLNKFLKGDGTWGEPVTKTYTCQIAVPGDYIQEMLDLTPGAGSPNVSLYSHDKRIGYRIFESDTKREISPSIVESEYIYFKDILRIHDFSVAPYEVGNKAWWLIETIGDAYSAFPNTNILFTITQLAFYSRKTPNMDWTEIFERCFAIKELSEKNGFFFQIVFEIEKNISDWIMECIPYTY